MPPALDGPPDMSPAGVAKIAAEYDRLAVVKVNSCTHKLAWNCLYRLTTPNKNGDPKCSKEIFDKWHNGASTFFRGGTLYTDMSGSQRKLSDF